MIRRPQGFLFVALLLAGVGVGPAAADPNAAGPAEPPHFVAPAPTPVAGGAAETTAPQRERWVFLVHGILMTEGTMNYLEERLTEAGFHVVNRSYPSTKLTIQESGEFLHRRIERRRADHPDMEINLVTHSMGGLVARYYLAHHRPKHFGALVQIAPPNHGSEKAERFSEWFFYRWLYGKPGQQLGTGREQLQAELGYPDVVLGVIAGGMKNEYGFSPAIDGDDDGTISVRNTHLRTEKDHLVLPYSHAFIMRKRETADQVIHFLKYGRFHRPEPEQRIIVAED